MLGDAGCRLSTSNDKETQAVAHLTYPSITEVQLRLGAQEDAILSVVRRWGWWKRAEVEGRVPGETQVTAVVLIAERAMDQTIRKILHRSFHIVFPADGGEGVAGVPEPAARLPRRGR
jgi:hypothetical protein